MDSVKQSAALCLLRLYRTSPDLVPMGDWTSRVVHLLNDQHLVNQLRYSSLAYFVYEFISLECFLQVGCCFLKTRVKRPDETVPGLPCFVLSMSSFLSCWFTKKTCCSREQTFFLSDYFRKKVYLDLCFYCNGNTLVFSNIKCLYYTKTTLHIQLPECFSGSSVAFCCFFYSRFSCLR